MATFRYLGEPTFSFVAQMGQTVEIRTRGCDGKKLCHKPAPGKDKFVAGDEITVSDARAIRHLRVDPRFQEVV